MKALLLAALVVLAGCASPADRLENLAQEDNSPLQDITDRYLPVSEANRPHRICLLTAGFIELQTDKVRLLSPEQADLTLGRLTGLQGAVEDAFNRDPAWREADMANAIIILARSLKDTVSSKIQGYISRGLSVSGLVFGLRSGAIDAIKGPALFRDVRRQLDELETGRTTSAAVIESCQKRIAMNREILKVLQ